MPKSPLSLWLFIYSWIEAALLASTSKLVYISAPPPSLVRTCWRNLRRDVMTSGRLRWRRDSTVGRADSANGYEVQFVDFFIVNLLSCDSEERVYPLCLAGCLQVSELCRFNPRCGCFSPCFEALSEGSALCSRQQQQQTPKRASAEDTSNKCFTWAIKKSPWFKGLCYLVGLIYIWPLTGVKMRPFSSVFVGYFARAPVRETAAARLTDRSSASALQQFTMVTSFMQLWLI